MATSRFNRVSRARNTSPMPPAPMGTRISYGPMREPEDRLKPGLCRTTRISPWRKCSDELDGLDAIDEHYSATAPCGFADGPHDAYVPDSITARDTSVRPGGQYFRRCIGRYDGSAAIHAARQEHDRVLRFQPE